MCPKMYTYKNNMKYEMKILYITEEGNTVCANTCQSGKKLYE